MTIATSKILLSASAFAIAAAAAITPVVAQADTAVPLNPSFTSIAERVGNAGKPVKPNRGAKARATGTYPLFQNSLIWFGTPNPNPPPPVGTPRTFEPLASLPGWSLPYYGWFRDLNFEACVLGLSNSITPSVGPYGTSTSSLSTGGC